MKRDISIVFPAPGSSVTRDIEVGVGDVSRISISATGNGPMGKYDIVRVEFNHAHNPTFEIPLHYCGGWQ